MAAEIIPYILAVMIFYDLSLHLLELLLKKRALKIRYYWPKFLTNRRFDRRKYTMFWTAYWGLAFVLILLYITNI